MIYFFKFIYFARKHQLVDIKGGKDSFNSCLLQEQSS